MKAIKKVKKPKKIKLPKLKKQAWALWSQIVRHIGHCELCGIKYKELTPKGKPAILNAHHLISRENFSLSWDVKNGISLCQMCHKYSKNSPHKNGLIFSNWYMQKHPENFEYLLENWKGNFDLSIENLQKIIENLEHILNTLESSNLGTTNHQETSELSTCCPA